MFFFFQRFTLVGAILFLPYVSPPSPLLLPSNLPLLEYGANAPYGLVIISQQLV
jgi:hypothetical protein